MKIQFSLERDEWFNTAFPTSQYLSPFIQFEIYPPDLLANFYLKHFLVQSFVLFPHLKQIRIYVAH